MDRNRVQTLTVQTDRTPLPNVPPSPTLLHPLQAQPSPTQKTFNQSSSPPLSPTSSSIQSPTRAKSMNDIIAEHAKSLTSLPYESDRESKRLKSFSSLSKAKSVDKDSFPGPAGPSKSVVEPPPNAEEPPRESTSSSKTARQKNTPVRYATIVYAKVFLSCRPLELLALRGPQLKNSSTRFCSLLSAETVNISLWRKNLLLITRLPDPSFISNFLLTYRRFATPRALLLGMQKRMNELNQTSGDVTLAAFAQMKYV